MEAYHGRNNDPEESTHLLSEQVAEEDVKKKLNGRKSKEATADVVASPEVYDGDGFGWTVNGLPLGHVVGEPMGRSQWNSSLFACCGRNDKFCSSDIEVCLLGSMVPCVLYGSNVERLESAPGTFAHHCLTYSGLYLVGNTLFGWNCLAPWFSHRNRVAVRRKFNLEASKSHPSIFLQLCFFFFSCHVDAVVAVWKMKFDVNNVNQLGTLLHISSAIYVLFAKKAASSVEGCLIRGSILNLSWSWSLPRTRLWVVDPNYMLLPLRTDSKV
ncbi:hypothetical protein CXB51_029572 [Gossypium anomalum]|uniref:Uncharacterized protein n=1 Tax=Gossypium anomalum TaxID=47600 RepID=A0A8J5Y8T6_9ROSI|nr:hypothetical protein CXB51_029572 [Gossypium anomalum]